MGAVRVELEPPATSGWSPNTSRPRRRRLSTTAFSAGVLALASCGGGQETTPDDALAAVAATCADEKATLAAAPAPVDDAAEEQFRTAHLAAVRSVLGATRDALEHVEDPALTRMERTLDGGFPILQGGWTARTTAAQTLGSLDRLDGHASDAGVAECGAAAWRVVDWETIYARHAGERPAEAAFVTEIEQLCASTLTFTSLGETGAVGAAAAQATARSGLADLLRGLRDVVPPESSQSTFFSFLGAAAELQQTIPDVPSAVQDPDAVQTRIAAAAADAQAAAEALGISC